MKFTVPFALAYLATGAYSYVAAPPTRIALDTPTLVQRDLKTAKSVLADVKNGFDSLDKAAKEFKGDPEPLKAAAGGLLNKVETGTVAINKMTPLSTFDCLSLIDPAKALKKQGEALAATLRSRKPEIEKYKQCTVTHDFLVKGADGSEKLITAVVNKVPDGVKKTVQDEAAGITKTLQELRDDFAPGKCNNAA